jgi:soluble lytic murein transglycosylase-like protein
MQQGKHARHAAPRHAAAPRPAPPGAQAPQTPQPAEKKPAEKKPAARPGLEGLRDAVSAREQAAGANPDVWALGPREKPAVRMARRIARAAACGVFAAAVGILWIHGSRQNALAAVPPSPTPAVSAAATPAPTASPTPAPTADPGPTPVPTLSILERTQQQLDALEQAAKVDTKDKSYDTAEDYFGSDDASLTIYDISEDVTPTPAPTEAPTPAPTEAPTPAPTEAPTPASAGAASGSTSQGSAENAAPTEAPTPAPTEAPTPAPAAGPVLQGSGSAACVQAYNGWDASLKQYAYDTAKAYGVSYELVLAIIYHESGFQASATHLNTNGTTDWGLMQINDVCFSLLQRQMGISAMSDLLDPYKGIQAGCAILAYHLRYTGNEDDALLRYQVGAGNYAYYKASGTVPLCYTNTIALRQSFYGAGV